MRRWLTVAGALCAVWLFACAPGWGQAAINPVIQAPTTNDSVKITTGLTYQLLLAAQTPTQPPPPSARHSLTIENNNVSAGAFGADLCYVIIGTTQVTPATTTTSTNITINGVTMTAAQASIVLAPGGSYQRYYPYVPSDAIYVTCTTTGDSLYVDIQ